jgi:hypothetical protein
MMKKNAAWSIGAGWPGDCSIVSKRIPDPFSPHSATDRDAGAQTENIREKS